MTNTPAIPRAKRLHKPSWHDTRLLVGVLLVLLSMLLGALALRAADRRYPVYAAAHQLTAGDQVSSSDLRVLRVQLDSASGAYLTPDKEIRPGTVALADVGAGELVPRASIGSPAQVNVRPVPIHVDPIYLTGLRKGSVVTLRAALPTGKDNNQLAAPEDVLERVTVAQLPEPGSTMLGTGGSSSVTLLVPQARVSSVLRLDGTAGARLSVIATVSGAGQ